ncbi:methionine adenosyltransferase [Myceligenerans salitolerans]|uniref:Methionine adenosyltransferase n=1 Tax=Myceligenerans salitolerans TaxID=1230528 RepID=A0ABS3IF98_9MICO|nr:methionine adenosyltransferase [Myceligenerans salitolerans]MBO0610697.1 hypothetical protein [Myceligenerans salitolerans]
MNRTTSTAHGSTFLIETGVGEPGPLSLVERKGLGHPDTLADHLAEELSRAYARYTRDQFGSVLHHNFDKLALLGGASEVRYGGGQMLQPVKVLVNGRAAYRCGGQAIPVDDLVETTVRDFFARRLPAVRDHLDLQLNITSNSSPGAVHTETSSHDRTRWFAPRSVEDLRERRTLLANDTSLGTGWAPLSPFERLVRALSDQFSGDSDFTRTHAWCGSDVKVMGYFDGHDADIVLCVPQISPHVPSRAAYLENNEVVLAECHRLAAVEFPQPVRFRLNVRDLPEKDELYLTFTGSSIESGDEGVVGRGNRVNGLITPLRPMNIEGANGKNPVYHVGKLYNLAANRIAEALHTALGCYAEVHLVSATGQPLDQPWRVVLRVSDDGPTPEKIAKVACDVLAEFPLLTDEILDRGVVLA